ncbi:ComF family protein [soil metagenome]
MVVIKREVRRRLAVVRSAVIETTFPRRCAGCGWRGTWVCDSCLSELRLYSSHWCDRCGIPVTHLCRCVQVPGSIARVRSAGPYELWLKSAIRLVKYDGESARAAHLATLLLSPLSDLGPVDALVPVPLHRERIRERGFNQAELLATALAMSSGVAVNPMIYRSRNTLHQVGLSAAERAANVAGAFSLRGDLDKSMKRVVLVDDVFTTGATVHECAVTLQKGGVEQVSALTLC